MFDESNTHNNAIQSDDTQNYIEINDLAADQDAVQDEHWLWGSVRRVRRGINQMLSAKPEAVKAKRKVFRRQANNPDDDGFDDDKDGSGENGEDYEEEQNFNETGEFSPSFDTMALRLVETQTTKSFHRALYWFSRAIYLTL